MQNIKAVIFDMDGTLIDTEWLYDRTWRRAVAEAGYEMSSQQYLSLRSLGRPYIARRLLDWYGEGFDLTQVRARRNRYFAEHVAACGLQKKPGAAELLAYLRKKGITTAVATATDLDRACDYLTLTGLLESLDRVISAKMVETGKPAPDVYRYVCQQLDLAPEQCLAVEDAPNGILSAYLAGCRVVMVPDLSQPDETISPMLTACVSSLADLIGLL